MGINFKVWVRGICFLSIGLLVCLLSCIVWAEEIDPCERQFINLPNNPQVRRNPLLNASSLEMDAIPFDRVAIGHIRPAVIRGLRVAQARVDAIRQDTRPPTFQNTIEALEAADEPIARASSIFYNFRSLSINPALARLAEKLGPRLSRFGANLYQDPIIFGRVKYLYDHRESLDLAVDQHTLLENFYKNFVRSGALLSLKQRQRVGAIDQKLSALSSAFVSNVTSFTKEYQLVVNDPLRLRGIPADVIKAAAKLAQEKGRLGAWVFTLNAPSYLPVVTYAEDRSLREEIWRAFTSRGSTKNHDNRPLILEIVRLRDERAKLLGYRTHSQFMAENEMAGTPEAIENFLNTLAEAYRPAAMRELQELQSLAGHEILPWDVAHYEDKLKQSQFGFSEEDLRPYFNFENVLKGAFYVAERLHGVTFHEKKELPTWHPAARAYEVHDSEGQRIALFYIDPFPHEGKRAGAWMNVLTESGGVAGKIQLPHVLNSENFTGPNAEGYALLSLDEVRTLFHEMGHALHGILTKVRYRSLAGTNVARDFVELPSQLNEKWATLPEVLAQYAKHYLTGAVIPEALLDKVRQAENFHVGIAGLRQINLAMLDMAWHNRDLSGLHSVYDLDPWEEKATAPYRIIGRHGGFTSPAFAHIFSTGYDSRYYSYRWADVLVADAFEVFVQEGVFNPATAARYRAEILERGGTEPAMTLYRRFRRGNPDPAAFLRSQGL